jgi:hypothetical protein
MDKSWFEAKITLGNVIQMCVIFAGAFLAYSQLAKDQEILRVRFELYVAEQQRHQDVTNTLEQIDQRVKELDQKTDFKYKQLLHKIE